jgi:hypothetical protein
MGVLMEHSQDVKCVAWHPAEEVNSFLHQSLPYVSALNLSADPRFSLLRRHNKALCR